MTGERSGMLKFSPFFSQNTHYYFTGKTGAQLGDISLNRGATHFQLVLSNLFYYKYICAHLSKIPSCAPEDGWANCLKQGQLTQHQTRQIQGIGNWESSLLMGKEKKEKYRSTIVQF